MPGNLPVLYPEGTGIPKSQQKRIRIRGPQIIKFMVEIEHAYPNINIMLCGKSGFNVASSILKRMAEKIEANE